MAKPIPEHPLQWMPKSVWGPIKWKELHARALAHLPMDGEREWFDAFVESIPCPKCQAHFEIFLKDNPPVLDSRPAFFRWTVAAHNWVRRSQHKPELTLAEALAQNVEAFAE